MLARLMLYGALLLALGIVIVSACGAQPQAQPSPTIAPTPSASRSAGPTPTASPTARPTVTTTQPSPTAATSCPRVTGGDSSNQAQLVAVRIAHNPGFDRLVYEFGTSTAPGPFGMPAYTIETATALSGPSGQPVTLAGNALFATRFQNTSTQTPTGGTSYTGSTDLRPALPLIKQARMVEDFERVMVWGVGIDRLVCPTVLTLTSPLRVVLDFPTPP